MLVGPQQNLRRGVWFLGVPEAAACGVWLLAWYAGAAWLLGAGYPSTYAAAAVLWAGQIPLLYRALGSFGVRDAAARTAALLYGFSPTVLFYAPLITSESVFNFLLVGCLYVVSRYQRRPAPWTAGALGAASGLLCLTRMSGGAFVIAFAVYVSVWPSELSRRDRLRRLGTLMAIFLLVVFVNALVRSPYTGGFSLAPSKWGAYNLMAGTNRVSHGGYSEEDLALAGFKGEPPLSHEEASRNALRIGIGRIAEDPLGFAAFALTDKLTRFWGTDASSVEWPTARSPKRQALVDAGVISLALRVTEAFWLYLNLTAGLALLWSLLSARRREEPVAHQLTCVVVLPMLLLSLLHLVIEVQPRYHIPYVPLLCALSALGCDALRNWLPIRSTGIEGR
jgi:4-amino-4-deoxy-L-arabinose transferase-like glycosyltransferase